MKRTSPSLYMLMYIFIFKHRLLCISILSFLFERFNTIILRCCIFSILFSSNILLNNAASIFMLNFQGMVKTWWGRSCSEIWSFVSTWYNRLFYSQVQCWFQRCLSSYTKLTWLGGFRNSSSLCRRGFFIRGHVDLRG